MTFDRRRRAPLFAGLAGIAVGAVVAGGATAAHAHHAPALASDRIGITDADSAVVRNRPHPAGTGTADHPSPLGGWSGGGSTVTKTTTTTRTSTATSTTTSSTSSSPAPLQGSQDDQVLTLVNRERADAGCAPLRADDQLTAAAQGHSDDMSRRDYFSHDTPEGVTFDKRIKAAGYPSPGAENIAAGQHSAADVMDAWMHSEGHRRNILNCDLHAIGIGLNTDGWYWTQDFGY